MGERRVVRTIPTPWETKKRSDRLTPVPISKKRAISPDFPPGAPSPSEKYCVLSFLSGKHQKKLFASIANVSFQSVCCLSHSLRIFFPTASVGLVVWGHRTAPATSALHTDEPRRPGHGGPASRSRAKERGLGGIWEGGGTLFGIPGGASPSPPRDPEGGRGEGVAPSIPGGAIALTALAFAYKGTPQGATTDSPRQPGHRSCVRPVDRNPRSKRKLFAMIVSAKRRRPFSLTRGPRAKERNLVKFTMKLRRVI